MRQFRIIFTDERDRKLDTRTCDNVDSINRIIDRYHEQNGYCSFIVLKQPENRIVIESITSHYRHYKH